MADEWETELAAAVFSALVSVPLKRRRAEEWGGCPGCGSEDLTTQEIEKMADEIARAAIVAHARKGREPSEAELRIFGLKVVERVWVPPNEVMGARGRLAASRAPGTEQRDGQGAGGMRTIIAGSRSITDYAVVEEAVRASGIVPSVVLCGGARGVDRLGADWAASRGLDIEHWPAEWTTRGRGAGAIRNQQMAENADALIAVWDGESRGTADMIRRARANGLKVYVHSIIPGTPKCAPSMALAPEQGQNSGTPPDSESALHERGTGEGNEAT